MISGWAFAGREEAAVQRVTLALLYESMGDVQYLAYAITLNMLSFRFVRIQCSVVNSCSA